jgi:DNA invertase Pin-like site-specific DNA recombinase
MSATSGRKRPGFEAMLADLRDGKARVVIAWSLDRLQRNRKDELGLYEVCKERSATIALINGTDLNFGTAAGRFVADSLGSVARLEVEMKSDRQKRQQEQAAADGRRVGGRRPFGYEPNGTAIRPVEADAIRQAYADVLAGIPLAEVARRWNAGGLRSGQTRWGKGHKGEPSTWQRDTVRMVLLNPRNAGLRAHKGEIVGAAQWPSLVPEETWRAARDVLTDPSRYAGGGSHRRALLSSLAVCGVCGGVVHAGAGQPGVHGYRCHANHFARKGEPVDEFVSAVVVERLSRPDAAVLTQDKDHPDIGVLRAEAMALRARMDSLAIDYADGALTASQLRTATARLTTSLAEVEELMTDAGRADVLGPLVNARDVRKAWEALPNARKRAVIDTLMKITIYPPGRGVRDFDPATIEITWRTE